MYVVVRRGGDERGVEATEDEEPAQSSVIKIKRKANKPISIDIYQALQVNPPLLTPPHIK
jgi:hypothetical protein